VKGRGGRARTKKTFPHPKVGGGGGRHYPTTSITTRHALCGHPGLRGTRGERATVCCSVLQCVACLCAVVCCSALQQCGHPGLRTTRGRGRRCVAVCCSVLQCVAMCCSVLQCVAAVWASRAAWNTWREGDCVLQCIAVCCSVCIMLQ